MDKTFSADASSAAAPSGAPDRLASPRDLAALHRDVWTIMRARPLTFIVIPALLWLPFDILSELVTRNIEGDFLKQFQASQRVSNFGSLVVGSLLLATFAFTLREMAAGRRPSLSTSFQGGQKFWGRVIGATFLSGFLGVLATLFFVIPGIYFFVCWALIVPVIVFEDLRGMEALKRSRELVQSRGFFVVLGYSLAFYLVYLVLALIPALASGVIAAFLEFEEPWLVTALTNAPLNIVLSVLVIGATLLYVDASGTGAQWPVGTDLVDASGRRIPPPRTTGRPALALASIAAGMILLAGGAVAAVILLDESGAIDEGSVLHEADAPSSFPVNVVPPG